MSDYFNYHDQIFNDIAKEFGFEATTLHPANRKKVLSVKQLQRINTRYGFDKAMEIVKRYNSITKLWRERNQINE